MDIALCSFLWRMLFCFLVPAENTTSLLCLQRMFTSLKCLSSFFSDLWHCSDSDPVRDTALLPISRDDTASVKSVIGLICLPYFHVFPDATLFKHSAEDASPFPFITLLCPWLFWCRRSSHVAQFWTSLGPCAWLKTPFDSSSWLWTFYKFLWKGMGRYFH